MIKLNLIHEGMSKRAQQAGAGPITEAKEVRLGLSPFEAERQELDESSEDVGEGVAFGAQTAESDVVGMDSEGMKRVAFVLRVNSSHGRQVPPKSLSPGGGSFVCGLR